MKRYLAAIGAALGMLALILDGKTALAGAAEGMELCLWTLIPSLFPFFVLSNLLTGAFSGSILPAGILGGYPVGAQVVAQAHRAGRIHGHTAGKMAVYCNCAGPSFLFGVIGPLFPQWWVPWVLWAIYLVSALVLSSILGWESHKPERTKPKESQSLPGALRKALSAMACVCGWVILFRILLTFLDHWILWLVPDVLRVTLHGLLELSNGCLELGLIESEGLRFSIAALFLGFGGYCVMLQSFSVADKVPTMLYFPGKLFQGCLCFLLAGAAQFLFPPAMRCPLSPIGLMCAGTLALLCVLILRKIEKRSSIVSAVGV